MKFEISKPTHQIIFGLVILIIVTVSLIEYCVFQGGRGDTGARGPTGPMGGVVSII